MFNRLFRYLSYTFSPPKKGDIFFGNSKDFAAGKIEQILHGLIYVSGDVQYRQFNGADTYRLTVTNTSMPYLILEAAVMASYAGTEKIYWIPISNMEGLLDGTRLIDWHPRSQPRRILKSKFKKMFVNGLIRRVD